MRSTQRKRETKETQISLSLTLDGTGGQDIRTGIPFFDHLVEILCRYMNAEATLVASGSIDNAIVLRAGADTEMTSAIDNEQVRIIGDAPQVARTEPTRHLIDEPAAQPMVEAGEPRRYGPGVTSAE